MECSSVTKDNSDMSPPTTSGVNLGAPLFKKSSQRVAHNSSATDKLSKARKQMEGTLERTREKIARVPIQKPRQRAGQRTTRAMSHWQESLLQKRFGRTTNPLPTDIHELVQATGLTKWKIQRWFRIERTRLQERRAKEPQKLRQDIRSPPVPLNTGGTEKVGRTPDNVRLAPNSSQLSREGLVIAGGPRPGGDMDARDRHQSSSSLEAFRADLNRIRAWPLPDFKRILEGPAEKMAHRIFSMLTMQNDVTKSFRLAVVKESAMLNEMIRLNPFSWGQKRLLGEWRQNFIRKVSKGSIDNNARTMQNVMYFKNYISPWVIPLVYSRLATQTRLNRSIRVAIRELSKLSGTECTYDLDTPIILLCLD